MAQRQVTDGNASVAGSLTATDSWQQSWTYSPVTSSDELRRLRALYQYAWGNIGPGDFIEAYPLVQKAQNINFDAVASTPANLYCPNVGFTSPAPDKDLMTQLTNARNTFSSALTNSKKFNEAANKLELAAKAAAAEAKKNPGDPNKKADADKAEQDAANARVLAKGAAAALDTADKSLSTALAAYNSARVTACKQVDMQIHVPDERFLQPPSCVVCWGEGNDKYRLFRKGDRARLSLNPRLRSLHGGWLLTERDSLPEDALSLGHFGAHDLYVSAKDVGRLSDFTLFVITATEESTAAAASAGGGPSASKGGPPTNKGALYTIPGPPAGGPSILINPLGPAGTVLPQ